MSPTDDVRSIIEGHSNGTCCDSHFLLDDCIDQAVVESRSSCLLCYQFAKLWERRTRLWNICAVRLTARRNGPRTQNDE